MSIAAFVIFEGGVVVRRSVDTLMNETGPGRSRIHVAPYGCIGQHAHSFPPMSHWTNPKLASCSLALPSPPSWHPTKEADISYISIRHSQCQALFFNHSSRSLQCHDYMAAEMDPFHLPISPLYWMSNLPIHSVQSYGSFIPCAIHGLANVPCFSVNMVTEGPFWLS